MFLTSSRPVPIRWIVTVQDPQRTSARRKRSTTPEVYDFRRPMTLARDHARALEMAFETFSRQWGTQLTSRLRAVSTVTLESVSMVSYDEYVRSLPEMTTVLLCTVEQTRSTAILELPIPMVMTWVDYLLGGPGRVDESAMRELTEIEMTLVRDLLHHVLANLTYAFAAVMPIDVTIRTAQYNPQFVQAAPASEPVITAVFAVQAGESESSASFMIPAEILLAGLRAGRLFRPGAEQFRDCLFRLGTFAARVEHLKEMMPRAEDRVSRSGSPFEQRPPPRDDRRPQVVWCERQEVDRGL